MHLAYWIHKSIYVSRLLVIFLLVLLPFGSFARDDYNFTFERLESEIPQNEIVRLLQDSDGFIWIGTTRGLYRYDGNSVRSYRTNNVGFQLLSNNYVTVLKEDSHKRIYIGTSKGLNIYDKQTGRMVQSNVKEIREKYISDVVETSDHQIWVGTDKGLYAYDLTADTCKHLLPSTIKGMCVDNRGDVWVGSWSKGLQRYDVAIGKWFTYPRLNSQNSAHVVFQDSHHRIWVGSFGFGLTLLHNPYDVENVSWTTFRSDDKEDNIADDYVYAISENKTTGTIWIGTRSGLSVTSSDFTDGNPKWTNFMPSKRKGALMFNDVDALINDRQGNIWIGTLGGGIYQVNTHNLGFHSSYLKNIHKEIKSNAVRSILVDHENNIWMGIGANGLIVYDAKRNSYAVARHIQVSKKNGTFTRVNQIYQTANQNNILLVSHNGLIKATLDANGQLDFELINSVKLGDPNFQVIEDTTKGFFLAARNYVGYLAPDLKQLKELYRENTRFNTLLLDDDYTLWTGTSSNGIIRLKLDADNLTVTEVKKYNVFNGLMPSSTISYLYRDSNNQLWAATDGSGICKYDSLNDCFVPVGRYIDFPSDLVTSIVEDKEKTLWLGTNSGLIQFFPDENLGNSKLRLYSKNNGLSSNSFMSRSVCRTPSGELYFGTYNGYIHFDPSTIEVSQEQGNVLITDIRLDDVSVQSMDSLTRISICSQVPEYTKKLTIPYNYSNFSIEFSPMTYTDPDKVRYAYRLKGFEDKWVYTDYQRKFAYYAHVPDGTYLFELKATNEFGQWDDKLVKSIQVNVLPPLWRTWWAYLIYTILIGSLIFYLYRSAKLRLRLKTEIKIKQIEQEKSEELTQAKLRFFTNITHELFTPITIVSAATEEVKAILPTDKYQVITSNTNRLIRLIQQILEFRKSETGNLKLKVSHGDLYQFILKNVANFQPLMKQKNITICFECDEKVHEAYFDSDKMDKILYNLLSNALKYNKEGNRVQVELKFSADLSTAYLSVADNGEGMSDNAMQHLFKRFYDGDFRKYNTTGTGIGLSLVNDLVRLHKGKIDIENHPGKGVKFIIEIPIVRRAYTEEECNELKTEETAKQETDSLNYASETASVSSNDEEKKTSAAPLQDKHCSILIVEDNLDLLSLLEGIFSKDYQVFTAANGRIALDLLKTEEINLIISDVMMPEMDGYELCRRVKEDIEFNHIPLILLTAKVEDDDAVEGYDAGADAYMTKPFSLHRLLARVNNLLRLRAKNISEFKKQVVFEPQALQYSDRDEQFIESVLTFVNQHYADAEFDQNKLAEMLALSRSTLHRKLTSLIGMTAANLIKDVRLKNAKEMISKKKGVLISEVAYAVGFNDPKYFSSCFKKEFGVLPSDYIDQQPGE